MSQERSSTELLEVDGAQSPATPFGGEEGKRDQPSIFMFEVCDSIRNLV